MIASSRSEIILEGGNFIRRTITSECLGAQEKILSSFAESSPVFIRNAFSLGAQRIHQLVSKGSLVMLTELTELPFNSNWKFSSDQKCLVPLFNVKDNGSIVINEPWVAPDHFGKLIFGVKFVMASDNNPQFSECYLFRYADKELHHFPYPNLFDNCRVCMGAVFDNSLSSLMRMDAFSVLLKAQSSFYETKLNRDLTKSATYRMFSRDLDGKWIIPTDFKPFNNVVSAAFMRGFAL